MKSRMCVKKSSSTSLATLLATLVALTIIGCDRFNDTRIFVIFQQPSARPEIREAFIKVVESRKATCWAVDDNAEAYSEFDANVWSFIACMDPKMGWVHLGVSDGAAFARLHLTSSGFRSEPESFANLRSEITSAFAGVVGPDRIEVVDGIMGYDESLYEAAERRRMTGGLDDPPQAPPSPARAVPPNSR